LTVRLEHLDELPAAEGEQARALARAAGATGLALPANVSELQPPEERLDPREREELARSLEARLARHQPHVAVLESARALRRAGACAVVTGQQPGFLASPLYSLYKALHAIRLARSLSQAWERPVVPLFWNHADDHDVAEVNHTWLLNENLELQRVAITGMASGRQPISRIVLEETRHHLTATRALLAQALARWPHAGEALETFLPREGETLASAFTRTLVGLLGRHGLLVLEPDWMREDLTRALASIVRIDLAPALAAGADAVAELGREPAIDPRQAALCYRVDAQGRHALRLGGDGFRYDGEHGSRNGAELAAEMLQEPQAWSPGALLRPLVQDLCLPVAAYVGGWGELAYHAQLAPLRRAAAVPSVPFVPRWSCTLVDAETRHALERLGIDAKDALEAGGDLEARLEGQLGPEPAVVSELRAIAERAARELLEQRSSLAQLDPGLAQNLARTASQVRDLVEKVCAKAERVHANRQGKGRRHVRRIVNTLTPRSQPQERVLGPIGFVAQHGTGWIDGLLDALPPFERRHGVAHLGVGDGDSEGA
jgi:bacillithiol biosynthesis cysteine-adding enzyme BshC